MICLSFLNRDFNWIPTFMEMAQVIFLVSTSFQPHGFATFIIIRGYLYIEIMFKQLYLSFRALYIGVYWQKRCHHNYLL